ncbi:ribonuclease T2-like [Dinochytrium kinnereticum]|nr:ribonuclease T2-like [Dinochytrium kinnereticum]
MVLAVQWIKGYCAANSCSISTSILPTTAWTIHGLCAIVTSCDNSRAYSNVESLISSSPIYASMKKYWISYTGNNNAFWSHEWSTHGTCYSPANISCSGSKPADLLKYLTDTLALRTKFDVYAALKTAGIVPGATYTSTAFKNAIRAAFPGTTVGLQCSGGYITEMRLGLLGEGGGAIAQPATVSSVTSTCGTSFKYF